MISKYFFFSSELNPFLKINSCSISKKVSSFLFNKPSSTKFEIILPCKSSLVFYSITFGTSSKITVILLSSAYIFVIFLFNISYFFNSSEWFDITSGRGRIILSLQN